jgi:hypothetical protein
MLLTGVASAPSTYATGKSTNPSPHSTNGAVDNMPRLGLDTGDQTDATPLTNAQASGARVARLSVLWSAIEPLNTDPSHYDWTDTDSRISAVSAHGLAPLVVVVGCPTWACVRDNGPLYDNMGPEVAQYMGAMAARYSQAPYNVHYWELWNEPDAAGGPGNQWGWGLHPDKYAQMLAAVYPVIKSADPNAVVMTGGLAFDDWFNQGGPFNPDFLPDLLAAGGSQHLDALAFHYYVNNAGGWTEIAQKAVQIRGVMNASGVDLPMLCTESGLTSSTIFSSTEALQARYLPQMFASSASAGVRSTVWYLNRDFTPQQPGWEVFALSGLTRLDNSAKPSFTAMQTLSQEVGSGGYVRQLGPADGITGSLRGYRFRRPSGAGQVSLAWNTGPGQLVFTIPQADAQFVSRAVDLYGQVVPTQPGPGGSVQVAVGPDPVYVELNTPRFSDVPFDLWAYSYIEYLASRGYVSGYADGSFRPGNHATRGQFSKMAVLGMGWPITTSGGPHFRDVLTSDAFYGYIETAYSRGAISGYQCGGAGEPCPGLYFRPGNNITRAQIAKIIVRAKGWTLLNPTVATFSDVAVGSAFYSYVETAVAKGVVSGYADHTFQPGNNATRAQLSKMLAVALQQP